jgi:hypothetical protein
MLSQILRKFVHFEGLIDHLDQIGEFFDIFLRVIFVVDIKHPLSIVFKLDISRIDLRILLFFEELLKQEVFD